jgi:signal transduction histidine kinase/ligand-binding sensor domain-containing protein
MSGPTRRMTAAPTMPRVVPLLLATIASTFDSGNGFAFADETGKRITQFSHAVWQEKDGLPDERVGAILQTRDGYLWFGTLNGLARFDGVRFTVFDSANSNAPLLHRVTSLHESSDGSLWAGSRNGLTRYRDGHFSSFRLPAEIPTGGVRQIVEDKTGRVWARSRSDLMLLRPAGLELVARRVRWIDLRKSGRLRVITTEGVGRIDGESVVIERGPPVVAGQASPLSVLSDAVEQADGTLWLAAPWGLGRWGPDGAFQLYTRRNGLPDTNINALCLDAKGTLWVGTQQGLARFEGGHLLTQGTPHPLSAQRIQVIYADRDQGVWIGTDTDGVHQLRDGVFTPLTIQEGLSDDLVLPILQTRRDEALWIGTARGLNRVRGGRVETFTIHDGLSDDSIFSLADDPTGVLWVGTGKGVDRFDGRTFRPLAPPGVSPIGDRVTALLVANDGSLWVGTDSSGVYRHKNGSSLHWTQENGLSDNHIARIHQRPDGSIWIATDRGITRWHEGSLQVFGTSDGLSGAQVRSFHEAGDSLWIGTYGFGLTRFRAGRFKPVPAGLPDDVVYAILEDDRGDLWLASNRGVIRVNRDALEALADGGTQKPPFVLYDIGDGMKSSTGVGNCQPAAFKTHDGRFWFPTRRGAVFVDPRQPVNRQAPPTPLVERLLVDGRPLHTSGRIEAAPGRGDLQFEFTAPSFRHPVALRFRYRLDAFDADWQDAGSRRTAQYTKVPPGSYVFRVQALTADGVLSREEARAALALSPHFYETSWFFLICASGAVLLGFGLHQARLRRVRGRFRLVLAERSRIAREMHDALDQGFAAITLQLNLCAKLAENPEVPRRSLKQPLDLAGRLLEYARAESKRSISDLRSQALDSGDLVSALSKLTEQFGLGDSLKVGVSVEGRARPLPGAVENNLLRICQEAMANAVRHGQASEVAIGLAFAARSVALKVKDAGRGFDVANAVSERDGHFGLMGIRERAQRLGGRFRLESTPGRGTEVFVEIPLPPETARAE